MVPATFTPAALVKVLPASTFAVPAVPALTHPRSDSQAARSAFVVARLPAHLGRLAFVAPRLPRQVRMSIRSAWAPALQLSSAALQASTLSGSTPPPRSSAAASLHESR